MSLVFERLPDGVLMPWLPGLILMLRPQMGTVLPNLLKEAAACFPASLVALEKWQPPWQSVAPAAQTTVAATVERAAKETAVFALLVASPAGCDGLARVLGVEAVWAMPVAATTPAASAIASRSEGEVKELLNAYPQGTTALAKLVGGG
jgi:hypothetical protein